MITAVAVWMFLTVLYILYIAAINIVREWTTIALWVKVVCIPIVAVMVTTDFFANVTIFTILFLDIPREMLVTQRLERYRGPAYNGTRRQAVTDTS